ncbi:CvpA family protein [Endozoicomonadaceae bacterium StTr2]
MDFNWVDLAILGIIAVSALLSLARGFFREVLSLVTWVVAIVVSWLFGGSLADQLHTMVESPLLRESVARLILFVLVLILGGLVNRIVAALVKFTGLTGTDRMLGMVFGAMRGILLVVVAAGLLSYTPARQESWWQQSTLIPDFLMMADWSKRTVIELFQPLLAQQS